MGRLFFSYSLNKRYMFPAARVTDMHVCPLVTPVSPLGGPILGPGVPTVLIGGLPAAVAGTLCTCAGAPDTIIKGSLTVFIGGLPAARIADPTSFGGMVATLSLIHI